MLDRNLIGAMALTALCMTIAEAQAFDDAKYPNLKGQWTRAIVPGAGGQPAFDPSKPPGRGQQAPLTAEYQAIFETNLADQAAGGHGNVLWNTCLPNAMPGMMTVFQPMEIVVMPETTYILINQTHDAHRRIYTDGRDWPKEVEPAFEGYSIGKWVDEDGDGRYDMLEIETRHLKGPRVYDASGLPLHADNRSVIKERIFLDRADRNILYDEITIFDNALTRPWTVTKKYVRNPNPRPVWYEYVCAENNPHVVIGKENYFRSADGLLMPAKKDQAPPDLRYFVSRTAAAPACSTDGEWIDGMTGNSIDRKELFRDLAARNPVVLLGESHTNADHHRWQLHTLAALHGRSDKIVIGFEAFPRRLQSVLDDWVAGKLTAEAFLKASEWRRVWGYDAALYMPLFEFARLNHIPMIALNVERKLVSRVGAEGWASVPMNEREGISDPAPASLAYQRELARVFYMKRTLPADAAESRRGPPDEARTEPDEQALADILKQPEFKRFVDAQLTWDRAMAEALAAAKHKFSDAIIVGIVGSGHVEGGYGISHQLKDLGVADIAAFIPESTESACKLVGTSYADAMFTLAPASEGTSEPERPRLGILLADGDGAPRIDRVVPNSVAEATGLKAGDHVVRAAGLETRTTDELIEVVGRQAPGTWLPLSIRRDGQEIEFIAKFPPRPRQDL